MADDLIHYECPRCDFWASGTGVGLLLVKMGHEQTCHPFRTKITPGVAEIAAATFPPTAQRDGHVCGWCGRPGPDHPYATCAQDEGAE